MKIPDSPEPNIRTTRNIEPAELLNTLDAAVDETIAGRGHNRIGITRNGRLDAILVHPMEIWYYDWLQLEQRLGYPDVTRIEITEPDGRTIVIYQDAGVTLDLQDDQRTLKIFTAPTVSSDVWWDRVKSDPSYDPNWLTSRPDAAE
jgi:hypothetical protein